MTWHLGKQGPTSSHTLACATREQHGTCPRVPTPLQLGQQGSTCSHSLARWETASQLFLACVALGYKCWILPQEVLAPAGIACTVGCVTMCYSETAHTMAAGRTGN